MREAWQAHEQAMVRSPYKPGNGLEPPYLGDRGEQLRRFRSFLDDPATPHNVVVTGLRGVGKTVLLQRYTAEARDAEWLVGEREFSESDAEPTVFAKRVLADLTRLGRELSFSQRVKGIGGGLLERATDFLTGLTIAYEGVEVSFDNRRTASLRAGRMLDDDLEEALRQLGALCGRSEHPGFVLRYDEFHIIRERTGWLTLSALIKAAALVQRDGIPLMLVLCGLPNILENLADSKSYSERMFIVEHIGHLRPPEDRKALVGPAEALGWTYEPAAVDAVMEDTQGYPYFIQMYGEALWNGAERVQLITKTDFERLRPAILEDLDHGFFESRYLRASPREREVLRAIAEDGEAALVADVRKRLKLSNSELQPRLSGLIVKGLIYRPQRGRGGSLAFTAPMFGAYVHRRVTDAN
jgi:hypothetical protein